MMFLLQASEPAATATLAVEPVAETMSFGELFLAGGFLMWPLLILGGVAVFIFFERFWAIRKASAVDPNFMNRIRELIFDGKVVKAPYMNIALSDPNATNRSRSESKDRLISFLKDALRLTINSPFGQKDLKNELSRAALSIEFLIGELS